ncbi:MAG: MerR family transcriptional regulator [bacterium]
MSKVRYLEDQGLISPARTPRGSRRYTEADVARLRRILRLQRDEYLPLHVIRDVVDGLAVEGPADATGDARESVSGQPAAIARDLRPRAARPLTLSELSEGSGLDRQGIADLERYGLIRSRDTDALGICRIVADLGRFGIEPRHLRAFRVAADREIGLVEQALAPHRPGGSAAKTGPSRAHEREVTGQLLSLCIALHVSLVRTGLP